MSSRDSSPRGLVVSKNLESLAHSLDGLFRVPGTEWRFGLDALVGLVPGVGDAITSVASFTILLGAVRHRVPKVVILRMALNLAIDYLVGSIPFLGDAFDFVWKANQKNMVLLRAHAGQSRGGAGDYAFVFGIVAALIALLVGCAAVAVWLLTTFWQTVTS